MEYLSLDFGCLTFRQMNFNDEDDMIFTSDSALIEDLDPFNINTNTDDFVSPTSFAAFVFGSPAELSTSREPYNFIEPLEGDVEEPRSIQVNVASEVVIEVAPTPDSDSGRLGARRDLTMSKPRYPVGGLTFANLQNPKRRKAED